MRLYLLPVLIVLVSFSAFSQQLKFSRAIVWFDGKPVQELGKLGIDITEGYFRKGVSLTGEYSADEIKRMKDAGFTVEIVIEDLQQHFLTNKKAESKTQGVICQDKSPLYADPVNFGPGLMGGFYTYNEMLLVLDDMRLLFPDLITIKQPIDATLTNEGLPIYYVKISDSADIQQNEPDVLYTALHHAREPIGMSQMIYYMWYLLENYGLNDEVTSIINNTELYFVPCLNPDGYIYNETTNPFGGGFWRKNRRDNGDGTFGVDLNRNYGVGWGFDDIGSSPDGFMETYRGTGPFSEPETRAMKNFADSFEFKLALNYHAFGNLLIYPWGYLPNLYTPDSAQFVHYGKLLTRHNHYLAGTSNQTVEYQVNGGSDDWMYGEQILKPKVFAMTPEVGGQSNGFWPLDADIIPLSQQNMFANLSLAHLAGPYAIAEDVSPYEVASLNDYIYIRLTSLGLDTAGVFTVTFTPVSSNIDSTPAAVVYSNLSMLQQISDSVPFYLSASIIPGDEVQYVISIDNGRFAMHDTITRVYGSPVIAFFDDASTVASWQSSGWGVDNSNYLSAPSSFSDSPAGDYQPNAANSLTLSSSISLVNAITARLSFYARWHIEPDFDYVQVLVSSDNGSTWTPLCGKYTVEGTASQNGGGPVYEGKQDVWVREEMDLTDYAGENIKLRFHLVSDGFSEYDGFYFDDLQVSQLLVTGVRNVGQSYPSVYPNPSHDFIYMTGEGKNVVIMDMSGKQVMSMPFMNKIDISAFEDGMYLLNIIGDINTYHRFVKAKAGN